MDTTASTENLTRMEAAQYLRIGPTKLWMLDRDGILRPIRIGGRLIYRRRDLAAFVERLAKKAARASR